MTERKIKELYKCTDGGFGTFLEIDYHTKKIRLLEMDQIKEKAFIFRDPNASYRIAKLLYECCDFALQQLNPFLLEGEEDKNG